MTIKKNISKILILSTLFNNFYFTSDAASNSNLSRYETLEGEVIDLEDTKSEDITEIEIFGNTVQDPNNLEDIQSVGELYVNKDGEPILDKYGKEQYKIEIESSNKNLVKNINFDNAIENTHYKFHTKDNRNCVSIQGYLRIYIDFYKKLIPNKKYTISVEGFVSEGYSYRIRPIIEYTDGTRALCFELVNPYFGFPRDEWKTSTVTFTPTKEVKRLYFDDTNASEGVLDYAFVNLDSIQIEESSTATKYTTPQSAKETLLLPCKLQKVGNVYDRLYWDKEKKKYIIEKNVKSTDIIVRNVMDTNEVTNYIDGVQVCTAIRFPKPSDDKNKLNGGSKTYEIHGFKNVIYNYWRAQTIKAFDSWVDLCLFFPIDMNLDSPEKIQQYLNSNNIQLYYQIEPQLLETNITEKIKLQTYEEKTYVYTKTENGINPTLKITVDRIEQVSQKSVNQAESNTTSSNIALARLFVNQLPDSLYKDQLQEKLNQLFSKDLVLEKYNATANLDVYIKSENLLSMSLDTNSVVFDNYSGIDEMETLKAINISVNSSLPYSLNAYVPSEITNKNNTKTMDLSVLKIKESSENTYNTFNSTSSKLTLKDGCAKGNNKSHSIDLKLASDLAHEADVYKTVLKLEVEQK